MVHVSVICELWNLTASKVLYFSKTYDVLLRKLIRRGGGGGGEKSKSKRRVHRGEKDTFQKKFPENYLTLQITTNYISN